MSCPAPCWRCMRHVLIGQGSPQPRSERAQRQIYWRSREPGTNLDGNSPLSGSLPVVLRLVFFRRTGIFRRTGACRGGNRRVPGREPARAGAGLAGAGRLAEVGFWPGVHGDTMDIGTIRRLSNDLWCRARPTDDPTARIMRTTSSARVRLVPQSRLMSTEDARSGAVYERWHARDAPRHPPRAYGQLRRRQRG
jgi:hypothetical protein